MVTSPVGGIVLTPHQKDLKMQFDIYRDQALERLLIVKRGTSINQLKDLQPSFLNVLERPNQVDSEVGSLPWD